MLLLAMRWADGLKTGRVLVDVLMTRNVVVKAAKHFFVTARSALWTLCFPFGWMGCSHLFLFLCPFLWPPLTFGDFCVGHHSPASPLLPAQGPRGSHWSHKRELNLPLVVALWEAPAVAISQISTSHSGTWGWPQIPVGFLHPPHINQPIPGSSLLFPRESDITHSKGHVSSVGSSCSG